jgi:hypothetical protein
MEISYGCQGKLRIPVLPDLYDTEFPEGRTRSWPMVVLRSIEGKKHPNPGQIRKGGLRIS